jgi:hypothetical protein
MGKNEVKMIYEIPSETHLNVLIRVFAAILKERIRRLGVLRPSTIPMCPVFRGLYSPWVACGIEKNRVEPCLFLGITEELLLSPR